MEADNPELVADPVLRHLPPEIPRAFLALPPREQHWRGRIFLISFILTGGRAAFSWALALGDDPEHVAECREILATTTDAAILEGLDALRDDETQRRLERPTR